jgi:hypothetical protein
LTADAGAIDTSSMSTAAGPESSAGSCSFLSTIDLKKLDRKSMVPKEVFL